MGDSGADLLQQLEQTSSAYEVKRLGEVYEEIVEWPHLLLSRHPINIIAEPNKSKTSLLIRETGNQIQMKC